MQSSPFPKTSEVWCPCGYLPQGGRVCAASLINHIGVHLSLGDLMVISNNNVQDPFISGPWLVQFKQMVLLHREGLSEGRVVLCWSSGCSPAAHMVARMQH